jgi:hypothetical protein
MAVFGCTSSDTAAAVAPAGPPVLKIESLRPAGAPATSPDDAATCVALGRDADKTITVVVAADPDHQGTIKNWTLAPPFGCIGTPQCGYLLLTVDPGPSALTVASTSISIDVPMARLRVPSGDHTLVVELRNSDGTRAKDASEKPYEVTLGIRVAPRCSDALVDAGQDGSRPSPRDSGLGDAAPVLAPDGAVRDGAAPLDGASQDVSRSTDASSPDSGILPDSGPVDSGLGDR